MQIKGQLYLGAVTKPPEVGKCACLTGPNYCSNVDIFIPDSNKRNTQMDVLHWTCGKRQLIIRDSVLNLSNLVVNSKDSSLK